KRLANRLHQGRLRLSCNVQLIASRLFFRTSRHSHLNCPRSLPGRRICPPSFDFLHKLLGVSSSNRRSLGRQRKQCSKFTKNRYQLNSRRLSKRRWKPTEPPRAQFPKAEI